MRDLPSPEELASLVDETMQGMYGACVEFAGSCHDNLPICNASTSTIIVPLIGDPLYIVTAHASEMGGSALAVLMFGCDEAHATNDMAEDSLRELCNLIAGQIQTAIAQDHELGLPSRLTDADTLKEVHQWSGARLRIGDRQAELAIAVAEFTGLG